MFLRSSVIYYREFHAIQKEKERIEKIRQEEIKKEEIKQEKIKNVFKNLHNQYKNKEELENKIINNPNLKYFEKESIKTIINQAHNVANDLFSYFKNNTNLLLGLKDNYSLHEDVINLIFPSEYINFIDYFFNKCNIISKYPTFKLSDSMCFKENTHYQKIKNKLISNFKRTSIIKNHINIHLNFSRNNIPYTKKLTLNIFPDKKKRQLPKEIIVYAIENFSFEEDMKFNLKEYNFFIEKFIDKKINDLLVLTGNSNDKELYDSLRKRLKEFNNKLDMQFSINNIKDFEHFKNKNTNINEYFAKKVFYSLFQDNKVDKSLKGIILNHSKLFQSYKDMFSNTRRRKRKITFFCGETNSGKTYSAFEELKKYNKGVYLAPLRLLAIEGQEEIEKRGHSCNLLTGEERVYRDHAYFTSSTIEMLNTKEEYDVAVIDEVQMVSDRSRGKSWFKAIIGVNAKNLILVGSKDIKNEIVEIANYLNEELEIKEFDKKVTLSTLDNPISIKKKLDKNTAVIAFSKKNLMSLKEHYESLGNTVSIIYGKLPPEIKHNESEKFRTGESEVLVATDAIGMGLNLPIKTIIFSEIEKFDGQRVNFLEPALIKQISGRAGRYNMFDEGFVTAFNPRSLNYIKKSLKKDTTIKQKVRLAPISIEIYKDIQNIFKTDSISKIVNYYKKIKFDFKIKNSQYEYIINIANTLNNYKKYLSDIEIVKLLNAPVNGDKHDRYLSVFKYLIKELFQARKDNLFLKEKDFYNIYINIKKKFDFADNSEQYYKIIDMINFFTLNFAEFYDFEDVIQEEKEKLVNKINQNLKSNIIEREINIYEKEWLYY